MFGLQFRMAGRAHILGFGSSRLQAGHAELKICQQTLKIES
jgi:hypothetical protein